MNLDKMSDERLFQNHSKEVVKHWCQSLHYFHYMRARPGHNCEGDSFATYFQYASREDLIGKLSQLGITLETLGEGFIAFDPFESYTIEDIDKIKYTIPKQDDLVQPQYVTIFGHKAHIWVQNGCFEISISGSDSGGTYKVSDKDFEICLSLEQEFDRLEWSEIKDENIKAYDHCISEEKYPELYEA